MRLIFSLVAHPITKVSSDIRKFNVEPEVRNLESVQCICIYKLV
jgi:hypothetical protein